MKRHDLVINIDRLVLTGLDLSPDQAQRLRSRLAQALQDELSRRGSSIRTADAGRLALPPLSPAEVADSGRLAGKLARQLADSLTGGSPTGSQPSGRRPAASGRRDDG